MVSSQSPGNKRRLNLALPHLTHEDDESFIALWPRMTFLSKCKPAGSFLPAVIWRVTFFTPDVAHFLHWLLEPITSKNLMPKACPVSKNTFLSGFPVLTLPFLGQHWYHINEVTKPCGGGRRQLASHGAACFSEEVFGQNQWRNHKNTAGVNKPINLSGSKGIL